MISLDISEYFIRHQLTIDLYTAIAHKNEKKKRSNMKYNVSVHLWLNQFYGTNKWKIHTSDWLHIFFLFICLLIKWKIEKNENFLEKKRGFRWDIWYWIIRMVLTISVSKRSGRETNSTEFRSMITLISCFHNKIYFSEKCFYQRTEWMRVWKGIGKLTYLNVKWLQS